MEERGIKIVEHAPGVDAWMDGLPRRENIILFLLLKVTRHLWLWYMAY